MASRSPWPMPRDDRRRPTCARRGRHATVGVRRRSCLPSATRAPTAPQWPSAARRATTRPSISTSTPSRVERLAATALAEPTREAAQRCLLRLLPEVESDLPGLVNSGLLATQELRHGVPQRPDWPTATKASQPALTKRGRSLDRGARLHGRSARRQHVVAHGRASSAAPWLCSSTRARPSTPRARASRASRRFHMHSRLPIVSTCPGSS